MSFVLNSALVQSADERDKAQKAEREAIERVLTQTRWNRRQAARILKISYKALLNKLKVIEEQNATQARQQSA